MSFNKFFSAPSTPTVPTKSKTLGPLQFQFKGKVYECIGDDCEFQYKQFQYLIATNDYGTLQNRIINQTKDHGDGQVYLKIIE